MPDSQRQIYDKYCGYVYTVAASYLKSCGSTEDIEDCLVETFTDFFRMLKSKKYADTEIKSILSVIAKRKAVSRFRSISRKQNRTVYIDDYETELFSEENIAENSESSELQHTVIQCIYKLKKPDPEIIIQHYYYGKSLGKIAENLKMTESAVQKRIQRARKNLKKMLEKAGINGV